MSISITFTQPVALATEMMNSLLYNSFVRWQSLRLNHRDIRELWDEGKEDFFLQRIESFSESLKELHIVKITSKVLHLDNDSMESLVARRITFTLGNRDDIPLIVVDIFLITDRKSHGDSVKSGETWKTWKPMCGKTIVCTRHPDPEFQNFIVFGSDALDEAN